jgi:hypothetical protein
MLSAVRGAGREARASSAWDERERPASCDARAVPESGSTTEVARALTHEHRAAGGGLSRRAELIEICEAILLACVAIATAWSGYQTAKWDSRQAQLYGLSTKYRATENRAATRSGQQRLYDTTAFGFWLQTKAQGDREATALFERRFRVEYRPAFRAWLRTDPFHNPHAPPGPLLMPQYHNAAGERAAAYSAKATAAFEAGTKARERGDKYLRDTVLLATVLFLTALAQKFKLEAVRVGLLGVSAVLLVIGLYFVVVYPRA